VPLALVSGTSHVVVMDPVTTQIAQRPVPDVPVIATRRGAHK